MKKYTDLYGNDIKLTEDEIVELLKKIYNKKVPSTYIAGTLLCTYKGITHSFNIEPDIIKRDNYWVSKIYVKNKTKRHYYWNAANKIINYCEERNIT